MILYLNIDDIYKHTHNSAEVYTIVKMALVEGTALKAFKESKIFISLR